MRTSSPRPSAASATAARGSTPYASRPASTSAASSAPSPHSTTAIRPGQPCRASRHVALPDRVVARAQRSARRCARDGATSPVMCSSSTTRPPSSRSAVLIAVAERADLLREPDVVPADQLRHDPLDDAEGRAVRRDRDHRVDDHEIFGAFERGVEVVAHFGRREPIEQPIELALEAGRVLARGPARAHLRLDLGGKLVDVDVVVGQDRSLRMSGQYRPSGALRRESRRSRRSSCRRPPTAR